MENENLTYFNISYKGTHALLGCSLKSATTYLHENKQWPASLGNSLVFNVHFFLFFFKGIEDHSRHCREMFNTSLNIVFRLCRILKRKTN